MTDQELQQLAREYAEEYFPEQDSASDLARYDRMKDSAMNFLHWLTKTHCIVSKEKVMAEYNEDKATYNRNKGDLGYFEGYWEGRVDTYVEVFGTELFEERSEK
ncbi:MAG: hypothetical protein NC421_07445 [Lachnospiraceae bacterium]|nr:hypothetical protein [Lachnospiraceae bacterium]